MAVIPPPVCPAGWRGMTGQITLTACRWQAEDRWMGSSPHLRVEAAP
jgi:hypothetical protein